MNNARLSGEIGGPFVTLPSKGNKTFTQFYLSVKRSSGAIDVLPVVIDEELLEPWHKVTLEGEIRSKDMPDGRCLIYFFAKEVEEYCGVDENVVSLEGFVCKKENLRKTPATERHITDFILAVNRKVKYKSDYIPCIAWGKDADVIDEEIAIGTGIGVAGRLQSRQYLKCGEKKTTIELSIASVEW